MTKNIRHIPKAAVELALAAGKALAFARKQQQWRQQDLAERLGVTRQTVARLERGDPAIALGIFLSALWLLDVPLTQGGELPANALLKLIEPHLRSRVSRKKERPIDDDF